MVCDARVGLPVVILFKILKDLAVFKLVLKSTLVLQRTDFHLFSDVILRAFSLQNLYIYNTQMRRLGRP